MGKYPQKRSLAEKAADDLIKMIKKNNYMPGDKLPNEYKLAQELNVSRSTLREAVKILVSRNILETHRGSGTFISYHKGLIKDPLGLAFIDEDRDIIANNLNELRLLIEPEMAGLAAMRANQEQKNKILNLCEQVETMIRNNCDYGTIDIEFHSAIAEASGNVVVKQLIPILYYGIDYNIYTTNNSLVGDTYVWHRRIAESIMNSDAMGAKNAMFIHIELNRRAIKERLSKDIEKQDD